MNNHSAEIGECFLQWHFEEKGLAIYWTRLLCPRKCFRPSLLNLATLWCFSRKVYVTEPLDLASMSTQLNKPAKRTSFCSHEIISFDMKTLAASWGTTAVDLQTQTTNYVSSGLELALLDPDDQNCIARGELLVLIGTSVPERWNRLVLLASALLRSKLLKGYCCQFHHHLVSVFRFESLCQPTLSIDW